MRTDPDRVQISLLTLPMKPYHRDGESMGVNQTKTGYSRTNIEMAMSQNAQMKKQPPFGTYHEYLTIGDLPGIETKWRWENEWIWQ